MSGIERYWRRQTAPRQHSRMAEDQLFQIDPLGEGGLLRSGTRRVRSIRRTPAP